MADKTKSKTEIKFAGIRHHGPGTSRALTKWLKAFKPDVILLECPADAKSKLDQLEIEEIRPPVALAIYSDKSLQNTMLLPFASFSPEWVAIQYAKLNHLDIYPIDLPSYGWNITEEKDIQDYGKDSLKQAFKLAGIEDQEKWWDSSIEESDEEEDVFSFITTLMDNWRALEETTNPLNELREAFMRTEIRRLRKSLKNKNIAVITGAYHSPAIIDFNSKKSEDQQLCKSIKKEKSIANWIPWSYQRLSSSIGYGAGVKYPSWYEHLYIYGFKAPELWFTKAALTLREKGIYVSTAEVLDGIELCSKLVQLKNKVFPSLEDLKEAINSSVFHGKQTYWDIIEEELLIGKSFGSLGKLEELHPIRKDFEQQIKKYRLSALIKRKDTKSRKLDLRKEQHLEMSFFLHRLNILGIYLGTLDMSEKSSHSNFNETWELTWSEDDEITLIQCGMYGNTIDEAVPNLMKEKLDKEKSLVRISEYMVKLLLAGLTNEVIYCLKILNRLAINSLDNSQLIPLCRQLVLGSKYGNLRNFPPDKLLNILEDLLPRVFGIFPSQCIHIDEKKARESLEELTLLRNICGILDKTNTNKMWLQLLSHLDQSDFVHPILKGATLRLSLDNGLISREIASPRVSYALRGNKEPIEKAQWLEGFLSFGVLGILYETETVKLLETFVGELEESEFRKILPSLKRSFNQLSKSEKQRLFSLIKTKMPSTENTIHSDKRTALCQEQNKEIPELVNLILT
ncbi:MAG: hypothetical protein EA362_04600 [Saprospirales bacterium]|nr:MAG: hypothetical protein EA362_04600 [Saprospirales bacterium]